MMRTGLIISAVILGHCVTVAAVSADAGMGAKRTNNVKPEVVIDRLLTAIAQRDLSATLACFSSGQDVAVVGSEAGERARGREAVAAFFAQAYSKPGGYRFVLPTRELTTHGDTAWIVADGSVTDSAETERKPYRLTAVLVREASGYRAALWSGSEPVGPRH
jgi:ketosteroid isomerase-like protein